MGLADWLKAFRELHERYRKGSLDPAEKATYLSGREELARALLAAQRLGVKPGESPRKTLRVARALQADLDWTTRGDRMVTADVGTGGFGGLLSRAPAVGDELKFSLRLPGEEPLRGKARVVDVKMQPGNARVSFMFLALDEAERERIELFVFDTVLAQLTA